MYEAPEHCPTCHSPLEVREMSCSSCETSVRGRWRPGPFGRLSTEQVAFLTLFVRSRGNLSEVERTLGVSYPTVRAKLEEIIAALDQPQTIPAEPPADRTALLEAIARGEIDVERGLARLRELRPTRDRRDE